ncbi:hypothetical protein VII00023_21652 [Vibrio ichthyoenteri ATCC 700023]|uniref:Uncharacterized protein n=1 Tax=Vibrio ichthyoenteri ATCC 700023 TaxID=870968 RepID=F9S5W5_9VIBR|nr:hypothetical protein VII00023_21652 [Vibrio ichthyoenteri ATCC 700023]
MGCCGKEKGCQTEKRQRSIPWFGLVCALLVILVAVNWQ